MLTIYVFYTKIKKFCCNTGSKDFLFGSLDTSALTGRRCEEEMQGTHVLA